MSLEEHVEAVNDEQTLYASVLMHSYAIAEAGAATTLEADSRTFSGIEDWGGRLLKEQGKSWDDVTGGRAGLVEVATLRNALAHGVRTVNPELQSRLARAGARPRTAGTPLALSYDELRLFRSRLRSLMNVGSV